MIQTNKHHMFCADLESIVDCDASHKLQTTSLYHHQQLNAMILTLPGGHTLKEHVSPRMLTLLIISGEGSVTIEDQSHTVNRGAWFYIEPNIPHKIVSKETLIMLLSLYTVPEYETGDPIHE